jgi:uncharacterized protein YrrD
LAGIVNHRGLGWTSHSGSFETRRILMATDTTPKDETARLIASNKVEGTAVYNRQGEKLGSVHNFMVDKRSGKVEYAVMSFGGFLGMGDSYHPLPWNVLTYDVNKGGYVVDLDKRMLQEGPSYKLGQEPPYDRAYGEKVYGYYRVPYNF